LFFSLGVPCILPVYFGLRPFAPFLIYFTYQKKECRGKYCKWRWV